jgi:hypothetical protein
MNMKYFRADHYLDYSEVVSREFRQVHLRTSKLGRLCSDLHRVIEGRVPADQPWADIKALQRQAGDTGLLTKASGFEALESWLKGIGGREVVQNAVAQSKSVTPVLESVGGVDALQEKVSYAAKFAAPMFSQLSTEETSSLAELWVERGGLEGLREKMAQADTAAPLLDHLNAEEVGRLVTMMKDGGFGGIQSKVAQSESVAPLLKAIGGVEQLASMTQLIEKARSVEALEEKVTQSESVAPVLNQLQPTDSIQDLASVIKDVGSIKHIQKSVAQAKVLSPLSQHISSESDVTQLSSLLAEAGSLEALQANITKADAYFERVADVATLTKVIADSKELQALCGQNSSAALRTMVTGTRKLLEKTGTMEGLSSAVTQAASAERAMRNLGGFEELNRLAELVGKLGPSEDNPEGHGDLETLIDLALEFDSIDDLCTWVEDMDDLLTTVGSAEKAKMYLQSHNKLVQIADAMVKHLNSWEGLVASVDESHDGTAIAFWHELKEKGLPQALVTQVKFFCARELRFAQEYAALLVEHKKRVDSLAECMKECDELEKKLDDAELVIANFMGTE